MTLLAASTTDGNGANGDSLEASIARATSPSTPSGARAPKAGASLRPGTESPGWSGELAGGRPTLTKAFPREEQDQMSKLRVRLSRGNYHLTGTAPVTPAMSS